MSKEEHPEFRRIISSKQPTTESEEKYNILAKTHQKMFLYIEKLEEKVKIFQEKHKKRLNESNSSISKVFSLNSSFKVSEDYKSHLLSISEPAVVFSI